MIDDMPDTVGELMTRKVVTVSESDTIEQADIGMSRFHLRHLPVVSGDKLIGLVTRSDLLHASSSWLSEKAEQRDQVIRQLPVSKIMQTELITVRPTDTLVEAGRLMWQGRLGCLPVTDEDDKLLGIVTTYDFVRLFVQMLDKSPPPPPSTVPPGFRT
jgi:acetoin utilization protein AcuB